jgi:hypothetical protein
VNESIFEVITMSKIDADKLEVPTDVKTPGGEEVLAEVAEFLEEKLTEQLPTPPVSAPVMEKPQPQRVQKVRKMVALTASCSEVSEPRKAQQFVAFKDTEVKRIALTVNEDLEESVLQYAKKREGHLDIGQCANDLKVACDEIEKALETLGVKGKIKIAS